MGYHLFCLYITYRRVMDMKDEKTKPHKKSPKHKEEKLTRQDIEELMGMHRDVYVKRNGAWRRK